MTWAPDGRATFFLGASQTHGLRHVRWERCGTTASCRTEGLPSPAMTRARFPAWRTWRAPYRRGSDRQASHVADPRRPPSPNGSEAASPFERRQRSPRTARRPSSIASTSGSGSSPTPSTSQERSTSSNPSGTATESVGRPVAAAFSSTLPASPALSRFDVRGTTWVCHTSTRRTSSEDTTTHGRRLSRSTQHTAPRATTAQIAPSAYPRRARPTSPASARW